MPTSVPDRLRRWAALLLFMLVTASATHAQTPTWQWATSPGPGVATNTVVDSAGNVYVTGAFRDTATFGATTLISPGTYTGFIARMTSSGTWQWAVRAGETGTAVALDRMGNVYVTGTFSSPAITLGSTTLTNRGSSDIFVAKLSAAGSWQWAVSAGGTDYDFSTALAVDGSDQVYLTGRFRGASAHFGTITLTGAPTWNDVFIAKLTPAGAWVWAEGAGGSDDDWSNALALDSVGNVYVAGFFKGPATFGDTTIVNTNFFDVFVAKLSPTGDWQWVVSAGGTGDSDAANALAVDRRGNVYVTGFFISRTATFGSLTLTNTSTVGFEDMFVAKLSPTGGWQWVTGAGSARHNFGTGLAVDAAGGVYVAGEFQSLITTFGSIILRSKGFIDVFVAKLTPAGVWEWAIGAGGTQDEHSYGLTLDRQGNAWFTGGYLSPSATFGPITLPNRPGGYAAFIARVGLPNGLPDDLFSPAPLTLVPNPAHHTVRLTGASAGPVVLLDALGRVVRSSGFEVRSSNLDLTGLPTGLYLVRAGRQSRRLVVE